MGLFYDTVDWLQTEHALAFLQEITKKTWTKQELLRCCESGQCFVYLRLPKNVDGVLEHTAGFYQPDISLAVNNVTQAGYQKILNAIELELAGRYQKADLKMLGPVKTLDPDIEVKGPEAQWRAIVELHYCEPMFRSTDIRELSTQQLEEDDRPELKEQARLQRNLSRMINEHKEQADEIIRLNKLLDQLTESNSDLMGHLNITEANYKLELNSRLAAEKRAVLAEAEAKPSHMLAIAGMLELLLEKNQSTYLRQETIAQIIDERHGWYGASKTSLTHIFADAKKAAMEATKAAIDKAEAKEQANKKATERKARDA
jgi:hypothetical protein